MTETEKFMGPGGPLSRHLDGYESRPEQLEMARAVEEAVAMGRHLVVEAGTGVGKSLGYLIPALSQCLGQGRRVVVSTHTLSLQDQLIQKDIPILAKAMPTPFTAVVAKGRSNYLAPRRLEVARDQAAEYLDGMALTRELERLSAWAAGTTEGVLQELVPGVDDEIWSTVQSEHGNCLGSACDHFATDCFYHRARRRAESADLVIVNHSLFFADLSLRREGVSILPDYDVVVLDEAHTVESVAVEHFGARVSRRMIQLLLSRLYNTRTGRGFLTGRSRVETALRLVEQCRDDSERFFDRVAGWCGGAGNTREMTETGEIENTLAPTLSRLAAALGDLKNGVDEREVAVELNSHISRVEFMAESLQQVLAPGSPDFVHWGEVGRNLRFVELHAKPLDVSHILQDTLFDATRCVVMTSATLSVARTDGLEYVAGTLGATDADKLQLGSPFDYWNHVTLRVPVHLGEPRSDEAYDETIARSIMGYVKECGGGAFLLFTSHDSMRRVHALMSDWLESSGFPHYLQGSGTPRSVMLERFKEADNSVLFGTDSFWQGVDVPGSQLRLVVIARLPFPVPTQPWNSARSRRLRARGEDPFLSLSLPEAVIRFKQGFGRLVRTAKDRGAVVVLDGRILRRSYGECFLEAIPRVPLVED